MMASLQRVASLTELTDGTGQSVTVDGTDILLVRAGDGVHALSGHCPHAGAPLAEGAVCGDRIICPWHKAVFRLSDGGLVEPPALDPLDRYPVEVAANGDVMVSPEALPRPLPMHAPDPRTFLIVGAGAAGTAAAVTLREFGFGGRIVLAGAEPGDPFDRTALSKFVMEGTMPPFAVPGLRPDGWFAEQRIERVRSVATRLDTAGRSASFANRQTVQYDAVLVCPGGAPKRFDVPGARLHGVWELRTREDAARILASARPGARAVVIGGGFIGLEVASGLRKKGIAVTAVSPEKVPFASRFGPEIAGALMRLHEDNDVVFRTGIEANRIDGDRLVEGVMLQDGDRLPADFVVLGVGVRPATDFVQGVARGEDGGITVDESMRAGNSVWAAGDVAMFPYRGEAIRVEHWRVAQQQARLAARSMLGESVLYDGVPFFWTYHHGKRFDYLGHAETWDSVEIDGDLDDYRFVGLLIRDGEVRAAVGCQRERATAILYDAMRGTLGRERALALVRNV